MAVVSPGRGEAMALKVFRLSDVPEHIRVDAALKHADALHRALKERGNRTIRPVHDEEAFGAVVSASAAMQLALYPSDHVYAVTQAAWDRMLVEAKK